MPSKGPNHQARPPGLLQPILQQAPVIALINQLQDVQWFLAG